MPLTEPGAEALAELKGARLDGGAQRCLASLERGEDPPAARLAVSETVDGTLLRLDVLWDPDVAAAFDALPGALGPGHTLPIDPWVVEALDAFLALHDVTVDGSAKETLADLRAEYDEALTEIRASRATSGEPIAATAAVLGGELAPFQWAGVRYALRARRAFLADEQGLGKTVEALAALEADDAFPAVVVCPASLKLNWERETAKWLPTARRSAACARARSWSTSRTCARTRRPSARRPCGGWRRPWSPTGYAWH